MTRTFNELKQVVPLYFGSHKMPNDELKIILTVELLAVGCHLIDEELMLKDSWVVFTGYNAPVLPVKTNLVVVANLRKYLVHATGKRSIERLLTEYDDVPTEFRLVEIDKTGNTLFKTPVFDENRKQRIVDFLCSPSEDLKIERSFLRTTTFEYDRIIHNERQKFTGTIPEKWIKSPLTLPAYKEKKKVCLEQPFVLIDIAKEMDKVDPGGNWEEKVKPLQLTSLQGETTFSFEQLQHIAGGLASGKSTFQTVSTYALTKYYGVKVGIIENNVQSALNTVKNYERLGIKAVAFIGKSERVKHQEQRLRAYDFSSFDEIAEETIFEQVSDFCLIQALANDPNEEGRQLYPCKRLTEKGKKAPKLCPLSHKCGVYQNWSNLQSAEVWVTTSAAVLQTTIPKMIDSRERLIYEAMYDLLDVIFVDEADEVQQQFDNTFVSELNLFGGEHQLLETLFDDIHRLTKAKYELSTNNVITNWRRITTEISVVIWQFYRILNSSADMRSYWKNRILYLNYVIYDIATSLTNDESQVENIRKELRTFANQTILSNEVQSTEALKRFINQPILIVNDEEIDHWLSLKGFRREQIKNCNQFYMKFKIFILLSYIERAMTYFVHSYPLLPESIQKEIRFPYLRKHEAFRPYIEEATTGVMYGYQYVKNEGEAHGQIKLIQYTGIGRNLLYKWPFLYEHAKGRKGPAVTLLSGTSYAPKSMHYHVKHTPNWLKSTRQTSSLTQTVLTLHDRQNAEQPIAVSGTGIGRERDRNLYTLTIELEKKIEEELNYWNEKEENRRVLLVVNSYDDAKIVGKALGQYAKWKGDYRILTRDEQLDEKTYSRPLIERFSATKERILVVPLLSVGRGYNIMDEQEQGALFGSVFFLIRPYPIPNDLSYYVQVLHGKLPALLDEIKAKDLQYGDAMRKIRGESRKLLLKMFLYPEFWKRLSEEERMVLAWYTFIPVWQMIGRLLRGGKDARVFYCDAKFHQATDGAPTLIDYWKKCMIENDDEVFNHLYGPFKDSILNIEDEGMAL